MRLRLRVAAAICLIEGCSSSSIFKCSASDAAGSFAFKCLVANVGPQNAFGGLVTSVVHGGDGCSTAALPASTDKVVLVRKGPCDFITQAATVQKAGECIFATLAHAIQHVHLGPNHQGRVLYL